MVAIANPLNPIPGVSEVANAGDPAFAATQVDGAVAVPVAKNEVREGPPHERAMIRKWMDQARVPQWLTTAWTQWDKDRKYVAVELFAEDNARQMTVNLTARAVQAKLNKIVPTDADLSVSHRRGVGSVRDVRVDAIRKAKAAFDAAGIPPDANMLMMAADQAEQAYTEDMEARERFCQTSEALGKMLWDEAGGTAVAKQFARQAMTVGPAWMKVGWQRNFGKDSLGRNRTDDAQDQMALLSLRAAEYAAGQFGQEDHRYAELIKLSDYARQVGQAVQAGQVEPGSLPFAAWGGIADTRDGPIPPQWLPEPEVWQGAVIDTVRPEALRWDWRVPFERWQESAWVMEQNLMDVDEVAARFGLTPNERDRLCSKPQDPGDTLRQARNSPSAEGELADPSRSHFEDQVQRGQVVTWERWDKNLRRRCIFVEGLTRLLLDEIPQLVAPGFFPYVEVGFNIMDGEHVPLGDVKFLRKIQNAINQRLTDAEESLWASMHRYIVKKHAFKDGEIDKLRGAMPHDVIEVETPEEIANSFTEIKSDDWNPAKYSLDGLFRLFELVSGMSISELGVTGQADFATEAAIADQASKTNSGQHAIAMADALSRAMTIILHYAATSLSEQTVKGLVGMAAYWPQAPTRMDLIRSMSFKVNAAGSRQAAMAQAGTQLRDTIAALNSIVDLRAKVLMQGGQLDIDPLTRAAFRAIDTDRSVREVLSFTQSQPGLALPAPQPGGPAGGAAPPQTMP